MTTAEHKKISLEHDDTVHTIAKAIHDAIGNVVAEKLYVEDFLKILAALQHEEFYVKEQLLELGFHVEHINTTRVADELQ